MPAQQNQSTVPRHQDWIGPEGTPNLVSVVIPTCNRADLLEQTLQCFRQQTYRPIEIIVVDDGAEDETRQTIKRLQAAWANDIPLHYCAQQRQGAPAARNRGALESSGEFIVFMDDDDLASDDFLQSRVEALQRSEPRANLAYGSWQRFVWQDGMYCLVDLKDTGPQKALTAWKMFLKQWELLLQGCVIRRELVSGVGAWNTKLQRGQDLDYKMRLVANDCSPVFASSGMVYYRMHVNSISGRDDSAKLASHAEVLDSIEKIANERDDFVEVQSDLAEFYWTQSAWFYGRGAFSLGYRELLRAKKYLPTVCDSKGAFPAVLNRLGLGIAIGPIYYMISRLKRMLGLSKRKFTGTSDRLP